MLGESEYYPRGYAADRATVLPPAGHGSISICSFLPDYPDVYFIRDPAFAIDGLANREAFASAIFWEALADQTTYSAMRRDLGSNGWPMPAVKLVGLLGTGATNIHPAYLLIGMSFGKRYSASKVDSAISAVGRSVVNQMLSHGLPFEAIVRRMHAALHPIAMPESISAYVPDGDAYRLRPNWAKVNRWAGTARAVLSGSMTLGDLL